MSSCIIDASVVIEYLVIGEHTARTGQFIVRQIDDSTPLYIPEFCLLECANVLWKRVRFSGMA